VNECKPLAGGGAGRAKKKPAAGAQVGGAAGGLAGGAARGGYMNQKMSSVYRGRGERDSDKWGEPGKRGERGGGGGRKAGRCKLTVSKPVLKAHTSNGFSA